ncbi:MAG: hydroxymyristoyl-ACP dehydratase [Casimicrobiaceae bacterium]
MIRDRQWIAGRIPHSGTMCLLDRVLEGDAECIVCAANSHRAPDNPLRTRDGLSAVHAIEYAAQAMALHRSFATDDPPGASSGQPPRGMLTSVRNVVCHVDRLDDIDGDLVIAATRVSGERELVIYAFAVRAGERLLVSGRATALLDVSTLAQSR